MKKDTSRLLLFLLLFSFINGCAKTSLNEQEQKDFLEAKLMFLKKDFSSVILKADKVLKEKPDFINARILKIKAYYYKGESQKALDELIRTKDKGIYSSELSLIEAKILIESNSKEQIYKAIEILNQLLSDDPYHFRALYELGKIYKELGMYKESLLSFRSALTIEPYVLNIRMNIIEMYKKIDLKDKVKELTDELNLPYIEVVGKGNQKEKIEKLIIKN